MTRYERVKKIVESLPEESRRICLNEGKACACIGCITSQGVTKKEFAWWLENHSDLKPLPLSGLGISNTGSVYLFDQKGYPIGTKE